MKPILFFLSVIYCSVCLGQHRIAPKVIFEVKSDRRAYFFENHIITAQVYQEIQSNKRSCSIDSLISPDVKSYYPFEIINGNTSVIFPSLINPRKIEKGSFIRISLLPKATGKPMNLFIRVCNDIKFDMGIKIDNFSFKEGNYYYNMSKCCADDNDIWEVSILDMHNSDNHKVKIKKLKKLLWADKCKD